MRKTIAQRMLQAKQAAPEIHVTADIRMDRIIALRESLNQQLAKQKIKLSVSDFITKAVAMALRRHPGVNATFEDDAMVLHGPINIGIAVALDGGLIVPVLPDADRLGLVEIRQGTLALAEAARGNTLKPQQMTGSTFTISNLGMYGVKQFDAILNMPEVGILAVGATEPRPRGRRRPARRRPGDDRHPHRRPPRRRRRPGRRVRSEPQGVPRGTGVDAALSDGHHPQILHIARLTKMFRMGSDALPPIEIGAVSMPATLGIEQEIMALVTRLSPEQKQRILGFVEGMVAQSKPKGTPPAAFAHLRGTLSPRSGGGDEGDHRGRL